MSRTAVSRTFENSVDAKIIGREEPLIVDYNRLSLSEQIHALHWYRCIASTEDAANWLAEYAGKELGTYNAILDKINFQLCVFARMLTNDTVIGDVRKKAIADHIDQLNTILADKRSDHVNANVVSIADKVAAAANSISSHIDELLDQATERQTEIDLSKFREAIKKPHGRILIKIYQPQLNELIEAYNKTDPQLVEGYSHYTAGEMRCAIKRMTSVVNQIKQFAGLGGAETQTEIKEAAPRRKRKMKPQRVERIVSKVKFLDQDEELGVTSLNPTVIVGKTMLVTFNAKYKQITLYVAEEGQRLSFKGGSLINVDLKKSAIKRIGRKTAETVRAFANANGGKRSITSLFNGLNGTTTTPRAAINSNVMLVAAAG